VTITHDPGHPLYLDEADTRRETARVFDVCLDCRMCTDLCDVFPRMIEVSDGAGLADAGLFTPAQQDHVIDACHHCGMCEVNCPHSPRVSDRSVDVPGLVRRHLRMRAATGQIGLWRRLRLRLAMRGQNA
jgi:Fe-S oxidoreductase